MKIDRLGLVALLVIASFLVMNAGGRIDPSAGVVVANSSIPETQVKTAIPSFLEKGKTYDFSFAFSVGGEYNSPFTIIGRIEKIDADSGWVYINHYVTIRKGKTFERKFEGYSWININQVYQCSEMTTLNP